MSLILDALNKAEREQDFDPQKVPDLQTYHGSPHQEQKPKLWLWLVLGLLACALLVMLVLYLRLLSSGESTSVQSTSVQSLPQEKIQETEVANNPPAEAVPATQKSPEILKAPESTFVDTAPIASVQNTSREVAISALPETDFEENEVAALYATQVEAIETIAEPAVVAAVQGSAAQGQGQVEQAQAIWDELQRERDSLLLEPSSPAQTETPAPATNQAGASPEIPAEVALDQRLDYYENVPFLHHLPVLFQNDIPSLMYAQHDYDQASVIINKKRYEAGSTLANGVLLEQVLYDGVLLRYQGREFKLSALNSWVNF